MNRRDFMTSIWNGVIGGTLASGLCLDPKFILNALTSGPEVPGLLSESKGIKYRKFGNTGLEVTEVGIGINSAVDPSVILHALDLGINYIDTAAVYLGGNNEKMLGNLLGARRSKAILATKVLYGDLEKMRKTVEKSLKLLKTDYIDVLMLHALQIEEEVEDEDAQKLMSKLKKQGKIRFAGVSTHSNMPIVIRAAAKSKFYDMVLTAYNFQASRDLKDAIAEAHKAGLAVVAMKVMAGGYKTSGATALNPFQAALKWVLQNNGIATAITSMKSIKQVDQNFKVMGSKMTFSDRKALGRFGDEIAPYHCRMCGACGGTCSEGVRHADILRFLMYVEGYREPALAQQEYALLRKGEDASCCLSCRKCTVRCSNGLDVRTRMLLAHKILA